MVRIKPYELRRCPRAGFRHAEAEFEVKKCQILHPEAKNRKEQFLKISKIIVFSFKISNEIFQMILMFSTFWPLGEGFGTFRPQIRILHAKILPWDTS